MSCDRNVRCQDVVIVLYRQAQSKSLAHISHDEWYWHPLDSHHFYRLRTITYWISIDFESLMWIWTSWSVRGVKTFISASDCSKWVWMYHESEMEGCDWDYLSPASAYTWLPLAQSSRSGPGYFWDLVPSVAAEQWSQWLMRWKLAAQLQAKPRNPLLLISRWDYCGSHEHLDINDTARARIHYAHLTLLDGYYLLSRVYLEQAQCNIYSSHGRVSQIKHPERSLVMSSEPQSENRDLGAIHQDGAVKVNVCPLCRLLIFSAPSLINGR